VTSLAAVPRAPVVEHIMGMPIVLDVRDEVEDEAIDRVFDWLRWVDATFSTFKADSDISRINRGELAVEEAHADVREVLQRCEELRAATRGYFDITVPIPGAIDPSGLVKGWAVDRAADLLDSAGSRNYGISAGGDMRVRGRALPDTRWRVGIQHPRLRDRVAAIVETTDLAIATSGAYARGDHIVDPHAPPSDSLLLGENNAAKGREASNRLSLGSAAAPHGVLSVTVCGPDLGTADAFATAAFAMGVAGPHWTARLPRGYDAMTILADERVLFTAGFPAV
jgi:thiamine biosynthesis lipoprotein